MSRKPPKPPDDPWDVQKIEAKAPDAKSVTEARKVLAKGDFGKVEPRADGMGWWVVCKGMTGTYEVSVKRGPRGGLESRCTCPSSKRPCKHALALLLYLAEHPEARPEAEAPPAKASVDFESLLRTAFAAPDDDTARLVLADYLEENDQPDRAALIRVQCALGRRATSVEEHAQLQVEQRKLTAAAWKLVGKLPAWYTGDFRRGFLQLACAHTGADAIPARFARAFHDGWVERLTAGRVVKGLIPLFRLVGEVDVSHAYLTADELARLVEGLQFGHPETRTRFVRLPANVAARYPELARPPGETK